MNLSVVGLGKLGSPMAAVLASQGHSVIGVDINPAFVSALNEGRAPVPEPGLLDLITANRPRLRATTDYAEAVLASDITFVIVPTPSTGDGTFSLDYLLSACGEIGPALAKKPGFHLVVVTSTVMPGATGGPIRECLEQASGKTCGTDFGLCYNPEFIALGTVIRDMLHPDFILIGESDPRSGELLASVYGHYQTPPPVRRMNFVNAELTKISVNTFVTTKITYANMLARLCEKVPGADADVVTDALGMDSRIGRKYLKGALGYGGPCFPRDNVAFGALARKHGVQPLLAEATDAFNRQQVAWIADALVERLPEGGSIGILGLSYKPNTPVIEESQGVAFARHFLSRGVKVVAYDPAAMDAARPALPGVTFATSAAECAAGADMLFVATPWDEFKTLSPQALKNGSRRPTVVDCWGILPSTSFREKAELLVLGQGPKG